MMLTTEQGESEMVLGSGDELAFRHIGVRGPWESERDVQRVVGSKGMNLTQLMSY